VLIGARTGKGPEPHFLTAYQILQRPLRCRYEHEPRRTCPRPPNWFCRNDVQFRHRPIPAATLRESALADDLPTGYPLSARLPVGHVPARGDSDPRVDVRAVVLVEHSCRAFRPVAPVRGARTIPV
jgi:hypothetical protein